MPALPKNVDLDPDGVSVWKCYLLPAEEFASKTDEKGPKYKNELIGVRLLGFFLLDFYKHSNVVEIGLIPYKRILLEIKSCFKSVTANDEANFKAVFDLGLCYRNHLFRVFRSNSGPVPKPSSHASRASFDQMMNEMIEKMQKARKTKSDVKAAALFRDGYQCMITGAYDYNSCERCRTIIPTGDITGVHITPTECAHLFSESAQDGDKPSEYAGTAFTMLKMFGLDHMVEKLIGTQANTLSNVLTLSGALHDAFDKFRIWLEPVPGKGNTYIVAMAEKDRDLLQLLSPRPRNSVTFKINPDCVALCKEKGVELPELPSRDLIGLRAACARVAHMSGAAEYIEMIYRDERVTKVMANDGSTGELLTSLIHTRAVTVGA